jgi:hypothetical protein
MGQEVTVNAPRTSQAALCTACAREAGHTPPVLILRYPYTKLAATTVAWNRGKEISLLPTGKTGVRKGPKR